MIVEGFVTLRQENGRQFRSQVWVCVEGCGKVVGNHLTTQGRSRSTKWIEACEYVDSIVKIEGMPS